MSALRYVEAVVGNSSSGLVEVPSAGIPTVNIGCRQARRTAGPSVINCGDTTPEILAALDRALSPDFKAIAARKITPYAGSATVATIVSTLLNVDLSSLLPKHFNDII